MSASPSISPRVPHLRLVTELFPGLRSLEMRDIIAIMTEKRMRRVRMEREDRASAIGMPIVSDRSPS